MSVNPELSRKRATAGRIGALESWGRTPDRAKRTRNAREAAFQRFLAQVPAEITDPGDREKAAGALRRAAMLRLSAAGVAARKAKAARRAS